ncbi:MAG: T9SS type A sorting domain-containing protein [Saprospiraceae bacterium]|nr:T9SS type A sorting domain-containing protein [Saprospiraceae bacterium]MCB0624848.1 T9SS type A sorting domain-containing protein [Saprospiraceae bacterium]MCB0676453.1 T9SS type A sorting domain-containing protein [Saprospiraceae bacterium]
MKLTPHILSTLVLLFAGLAYGQAQDPVKAMLPGVYGTEGSTVELDLKVENFQDMVNSQFALSFDTMILQYLEVSNFGLTLNGENFGEPGEGLVENGEFSFLWVADDIINGESVADQTTLFTLSFKIIGMMGDSSPVAFVDDPTPIEFGGVNGVLEHELQDGYVKVGMIDAVEEVITPHFTFYPITPNPIRESAQLRVDLPRNASIQLKIFDATGRQLHRSVTDLYAGTQIIPLPKSLFPAPGTYLIQLSSGEATASQKVLVVD